MINCLGKFNRQKAAVRAAGLNSDWLVPAVHVHLEQESYPAEWSGEMGFVILRVVTCI